MSPCFTHGGGLCVGLSSFKLQSVLPLVWESTPALICICTFVMKCLWKAQTQLSKDCLYLNRFLFFKSPLNLEASSSSTTALIILKILNIWNVQGFENWQWCVAYIAYCPVFHNRGKLSHIIICLSNKIKASYIKDHP